MQLKEHAVPKYQIKVPETKRQILMSVIAQCHLKYSVSFYPIEGNDVKETLRKPFQATCFV